VTLHVCVSLSMNDAKRSKKAYDETKQTDSFKEEKANEVSLSNNVFDKKKPNKNASFSPKQTCTYIFGSSAIRTCE